jgi:cyclase
MNLSPVSVRIGGLAAIAVLALTGPPGAIASELPAFPESPKSHEWQKVGEGVFAFISPIGITPMVSGNSLVVIGDGGVLVVDTGQFPSLARAEIAGIRQLTPLPVRYVVNTHWHPDHWIGNDEFRRAYPGVSIIATQNTRDLAASLGSKYATPAYATETIKAVDEALARGTRRDGTVLTPGQRATYGMGRTQLGQFGTELATTRLIYPDLIFSNDLDLYLGSRHVQVRFLGRGNTGGDAIVYVPDAKVLATGDLLVNPFPYGTGSFYGEWPDTLRKLAGIDASVIVPGHGEVERDQKYLGRMIALLDSVKSQVSESVRAGRSLDETRALVTLADAKHEFCRGLPFADWCENSFQYNFVVPSVARSYKEQKEGPLTSEE